VFTPPRHIAWALVVGLSAGFVLPPVPARAETSYHKLKVRLRRFEHNTGEVLGVVGEEIAHVMESSGGGDDEISLPDINFERGPKPLKGSPPSPPPAKPATKAKSTQGRRQ
jgi:hypothetical protein